MAIYNTINLSEIRPDRFDAEYFSKSYKDNLQLIEKTGNVYTLGRLFAKVDRGDKAEYKTVGPIPVLRSVNVRTLGFNDTRQEYVTNEYFDKKPRGRVIKDDIIITSTGTGTLGRTSIWYKDTKAFNVPENSFLRGPINVDPYLIAAFLSTEFGIQQLFQHQRGSSGQLHLYPVDIKRIIVPECLFHFENEIGGYLRKAFELLEQSKNLYDKASYIFEEKYNLNEISLVKPTNYIVNISEITESRRMNSEYFSPSVKNILKQSFLANSKTIGSLYQIIRGTSPEGYIKNGIPVIKTKNVRVPEIDRERVSDFVQSTKDLTAIQENDLLLASMGVGSLGRMSYVFSLDEDMVVDGTIRVFRRKSSTPINYEIPTLLFLSTKVGQELIYRGIVGSTGIISLPDDYLSKIPIPHFPEELCLELTRLVKESMMAKRESKRLIEEAKTRVEQLIDEAANKN